MNRANWVYLDGAFMTADEARISPFDRGFLFGQAAYEVTAVFNRKMIDFDLHMARFQRTLEGIEIAAPEIDLRQVHEALIERNDLEEGVVYLQATAGNTGPRDYYGPELLTPSVFMFAAHEHLISEKARDGISAISVEDTRWKRRDLKTTQLLSQSLAYRAARRAGTKTAILHENGLVTEAASANLWIVTRDGRLITRDLSPALLPGITRARLLHLLERHVAGIEERAFTLDELRGATEAFTSSTGAVIAPLIGLDGEAIGNGKPGPVTRRVQAAYYDYLGANPDHFDWL